MLITKPFFKNYNVPEFKRNTSFLKTIYHYIIGTIVLLVMNIKLFSEIIFKYKTEKLHKLTTKMVCYTTKFIKKFPWGKKISNHKMYKKIRRKT